MSPLGRPLTQAFVRELSAGPGATVVVGRFEGVDERGEGSAIPPVLISGDHGAIEHWCRIMAERLTQERWPDLLSR